MGRKTLRNRWASDYDRGLAFGLDLSTHGGRSSYLPLLQSTGLTPKPSEFAVFCFFFKD